MNETVLNVLNGSLNETKFKYQKLQDELETANNKVSELRIHLDNAQFEIRNLEAGIRAINKNTIRVTSVVTGIEQGDLITFSNPKKRKMKPNTKRKSVNKRRKHK